MIAVAAWHGWRVQEFHENPWIGAGFGMFAEIDGPQRVVHLIDTEGAAIIGPSYSSNSLTVVANFPTPTALERFVNDESKVNGISIWGPTFEGGELGWELIASASD